jgi:hypothetical protein
MKCSYSFPGIGGSTVGTVDSNGKAAVFSASQGLGIPLRKEAGVP